MTAAAPPDAIDVLAAADRIAGQVHRTPLLTLSGLPGLPAVLAKAEHLQCGGSFKSRGAANAVLGLGADAIVTGSSGNHGIALARLGAALRTAVTVVVAAGAEPGKTATMRDLGARVVQVAGGVVERDRCAAELADRTGAVFVPSSDHPLVVAGAGTVGLEVFDELPDLDADDAVFVPVGGGGLLAGVCLAAEGLPRRPRIVGVEPLAARRYARTLAAGRPVELPPSTTIADGLRGQRPGVVPLPIIRRRVDDLVGVDDTSIVHAMELLRRNGLVAEPSGSAALAGALGTPVRGRVVVVVSGGNTVDLR